MNWLIWVRRSLSHIYRVATPNGSGAHVLAWFGWGLVASGGLHAAFWLAAGRPSLADFSCWRKPIVFGLSTGITTLSIAQFQYMAHALRRVRWIYIGAMAIELFLIDLQAWRRVESHFNISTQFDTSIFVLMGLSIVVAVSAAIDIGLTSIRRTSDGATQAATRLALFGLGMGALVGIGMSLHGSYATFAAVPPPIGPTRGLLLPHAIALHGLQLFPVWNWWLTQRNFSAARRLASLRWVASGWGVFIAANILNWFVSGSPAITGLGCLVAALCFIRAVFERQA